MLSRRFMLLGNPGAQARNDGLADRFLCCNIARTKRRFVRPPSTPRKRSGQNRYCNHGGVVALLDKRARCRRTPLDRVSRPFVERAGNHGGGLEPFAIFRSKIGVSQGASSTGLWYALLIVGTILISTSAILVTLAGAPPTVSAFYRNFLAAAIWVAILLPFRRSKLWRLPPRSEANGEDPAVRLPFNIPIPSSPLLFGLLGFFFACDLWAWHRAILHLGAGPATLMGNLQVLFVSFLGAKLFGERLSRWYWTGCALALLGIGLLNLTRGFGESILLGLLFGTITALTYAIFLIVIKLLGRYGTGAAQTLFLVSLISAAFLALAVMAEGLSFRLHSKAAFLLLLTHAFVSSVVGWWLIIRAIKHLPVSIASVILLLQPVLTSVWGDLVLDQHLTVVQMAGIVIALAGIRLASRASG